MAHLTKGKLYRLSTYNKEDIVNPEYNCLFPGAVALQQTNGMPEPMVCDADYCSKAGVYVLKPSDGNSFPVFEKKSTYTGEVGTAYLSFQNVTPPYPLPSSIYLVEGGPALKGDVNLDGKVDISDIVAVINQVAGTSSYKNADVNGDNKVDISDIVAIINIIAGN